MRQYRLHGLAGPDCSCWPGCSSGKTRPASCRRGRRSSAMILSPAKIPLPASSIYCDATFHRATCPRRSVLLNGKNPLHRREKILQRAPATGRGRFSRRRIPGPPTSATPLPPTIKDISETIGNRKTKIMNTERLKEVLVTGAARNRHRSSSARTMSIGEGADRHLHGQSCADRGCAGGGEDAAGAHAGARAGRGFCAHPVHPGPDAGGHHGHECFQSATQ